MSKKRESDGKHRSMRQHLRNVRRRLKKKERAKNRYEAMCEQFGPDFEAHGIGRIQVQDYNFPFAAPELTYILDSFKGRTYEPMVCNHLIENFRTKVITFIDIGAYYGYFSALAAQLHPDVQVYAFEPWPDSWEVLDNNFRLNGIKGGVYRIALSDENGTVTFKDRSMEADGEGSIEVLSQTFDSWCKEHQVIPDIVKLDVHGGEGKVLFGMQQTLAEVKPLIYFELHPEDILVGYTIEQIITLLEQNGYSLKEMPEFRADAEGDMIPVDADYRKRLVNMDLWTEEEYKARRMFLCEVETTK